MSGWEWPEADRECSQPPELSARDELAGRLDWWLDRLAEAEVSAELWDVYRTRRAAQRAGDELAAYDEGMAYLGKISACESDADRLARAGGLDFTGWAPYAGPVGDRCECGRPVEARVSECGACVRRRLWGAHG